MSARSVAPATSDQEDTVRQDALRRREALVREARRIFAQAGAGVALEVVAEAAGVGIATLYRNFPSREAVLDAVAEAVLDDLITLTRDALSQFDENASAWDVWSGWARSAASLELGALSATLAGEYGARVTPRVLERQALFAAELEGLVARVREAGLVGDDLTSLELVVAIGRLTRPHVATGGVMSPDLGERLVELLLEGLRERASGR